MFAGPLFMTLLARFFLRERVGPHRLAAVVVGFVGVLIVIRPGSEAMTWAVLLPLAVALLDSIRDIVTRRMTTGESSQRIVLTTALVLALAGSSTSLQGWQSLRQVDLVWFVTSASCFVIANFFMIEAFRHAQIVVIAPFKYLQLCWSIIAGLLFWGEVPDLLVIVGIGVIFSSGIYIGWPRGAPGPTVENHRGSLSATAWYKSRSLVLTRLRRIGRSDLSRCDCRSRRWREHFAG